MDYKSIILEMHSDSTLMFLYQANRYKFTTASQIRNPPTSVQPGVMTQVPPQSVVIPGQEPLTATMLAAAPPQEQKQVCIWVGLFSLLRLLYICFVSESYFFCILYAFKRNHPMLKNLCLKPKAIIWFIFAAVVDMQVQIYLPNSILICYL